ncbi:MAG: NAD(P)/FAD-dependent oxidoreductase [Thermoleophilia bacterium]|nr:NAD(P)/FAD-dependent oxidoreductase [Thermoleophilia bacterium]MDH3725843.1 NAD(P)/FAD-dependent oxidoreductase [Thermoleophilia bacterium]
MTDPAASPHGEPARIVIVGGGFGGFYTALHLEKLAKRSANAPEVTLVSETNHLVYTPFLPSAAGGTLEPRHVVVPLRPSLRRTRVFRGRVSRHDRERKQVTFESESGSSSTLPYDHLVVALGSVSRTLPIAGLADAAVGFKTLAEAIFLRNHVLRQLELAETAADPDERSAMLTFVFIGGGYAGVEALAELEDLARDTKDLYPGLANVQTRWILVEATERIFPEVGARLGAYALRQLARRGVELRLGTTVIDASGGAVTLSSGEVIPCRTLVWTAGVRSNPAVVSLGLPVDERGRAKVDETMAVDGMPGVWSLGDAAAVPDPARPGLACPPTAQHVMRQGKVLAANLLATIAGAPAEPFRYRTRGLFVDLGRNKAVVSMMGLHFAGLPAWLVTRTYHLSRIPGFRRKARVAADWTIGLLFRRDTSELGSLGHPKRLDE